MFNGFITMCNLRLIRASFSVLLQVMFMSDWKQSAQRLKLQKRPLTINKREIIRWNNDKYLSVSENLCLCFMLASRRLLISKMNPRQENCSKLSFTARIIAKYSLERFLFVCGEKMSKGFSKFYKLIIKPDTRSDHCLKSYKPAKTT